MNGYKRFDWIRIAARIGLHFDLLQPHSLPFSFTRSLRSMIRAGRRCGIHTSKHHKAFLSKPKHQNFISPCNELSCKRRLTFKATQICNQSYLLNKDKLQFPSPIEEIVYTMITAVTHDVQDHRNRAELFRKFVFSQTADGFRTPGPTYYCKVTHLN